MDRGDTMPVIESAGCPLHVEIEGAEKGPVLMLSNSLGTDLSMWERQLPAFAKHFRVVRYDRRGHGKSGVTPGPYSMEQLGRDALAIMDGLELDKVHWCGLSMGGMEGQWLGANAPARIGKLVLANTSSYYAVKDPWNERLKAIRQGGIEAVADRVLAMWFTKDFFQREPQTVARFRAMMVSTPLDGYIACGEAVRDMDHRALLARITRPTLVIAGRYDNATPLDVGEFIRSRIPGAQLTIIDAAHISNVEQPGDFTAEVLGFLRS
jgi:3-oxoadipate enol-lactonase